MCNLFKGVLLGSRNRRSSTVSGPSYFFFILKRPRIRGIDFQSQLCPGVAPVQAGGKAAGAAGRVTDVKATQASRAQTRASRLIAMQARRHSNSVLGLFCIKFCQRVLFSVCIIAFL